MNEFKQRQFSVTAFKITGPFDLHFTPLSDQSELFSFGIRDSTGGSKFSFHKLFQSITRRLRE